MEFVVGKNSEGQNSVFGIADKIDGKDLSVIEITRDTVSRVEEIYAKIARYYFAKLYKDGPYLADISGPTQYVYGKRRGSEVNDIYLVDADLYFRSEKAALYNMVLWLVRLMSATERRFGARFAQAREIIQHFLDAPLPGGLSEKTSGIIHHIVDRTQKYLRGEKITEDTDAHPVFSKFEE